ncbi:MAG: hypothetical protein ABSD99_03410 [Candidatus Bathyarchaeia archaeon]
MLDIKEITENIFKLDKRIRYVAILNPRYDLLESKMREGVSSLTPAQTDRDFIRMAAPLMVDSAEKLRPFCGTMRRLTVRYDKVFLAFYRTAAHLLILSLEPQVDQALLDEIGNSVRKLELAVAEDEDKDLSS